MSETLIRRARPEDAATVATLGRRTFIETFVEGFGIPYPPEDLRVYLDTSLTPKRIRTQLANPDEAWWVAERDHEVVGFANAGPNTLPHPDARTSHAELRRLYVVREAQGTGLGTRMLTLALEWMETHTEGPLWIGVWCDCVGFAPEMNVRGVTSGSCSPKT